MIKMYLFYEQMCSQTHTVWTRQAKSAAGPSYFRTTWTYITRNGPLLDTSDWPSWIFSISKPSKKCRNHWPSIHLWMIDCSCEISWISGSLTLYLKPRPGILEVAGIPECNIHDLAYMVFELLGPQAFPKHYPRVHVGIIIIIYQKRRGFNAIPHS